MANKSEHPRCSHPKCECTIICHCYMNSDLNKQTKSTKTKPKTSIEQIINNK